MTRPIIFLILFAGLLIAGLASLRLARNDRLARTLWLMAGAMPGSALLVGEPRFMLAIPVVLGGIALRYRAIHNRQHA